MFWFIRSFAALVLAFLIGQSSLPSRLEKAEEPVETPPVARDISLECFFNGQSGQHHNLTDGNYAKVFKTGSKDHARALRITTPEGEVAGAIYIQWNTLPLPLNIQTETPEGEWVTVAECDGDFFAQYCPVPDLSDFRIVCRDDPMKQLAICELKVLTPGTPPEGIQVWQKPGGKVDLMLLAGHPDDELLWFGGLLPYYAGELGKNVLVITAAMNRPLRRLELCDALWACGVRTHPIHVVRFDFSTTDMHSVLSKWGGEEQMKEIYTEYIRKYKPDVLVLQDIYGEYGHGIHKAVSWLGRECSVLAADSSAYPEQAREWGTWDVPKIYIHLYPENQLQMNWDVPLSNFGGKTAFDVAAEAMLQHKSQVEHGWALTPGGEMDNSLFGLYKTLVGPDVEKNDFFEHLSPPE